MVSSSLTIEPRFTKRSRVGIIGAGRLGSSLALALKVNGYTVAALSSRRAEHREWLSQRFVGAKITAEARPVADASDIVFIATSDGAIRPVCDSVRWRIGQAALHLSGALALDSLEHASANGAITGGIHPLQTFPSPEASGSFDGITFAVESPDPGLADWLAQVARDLGGNPISIRLEQRAAYHTAAVMACGLLASLTGLAAEVWASTGGVSRAEAVSALTPLVKTTANWMGQKGLPQALTGPYVRGDVTTVLAHVAASSGVSEEHGAAYAALALAGLHIAEEQGGLTTDSLDAIRKILETALQDCCEIIDRA
jgi:predicted short-subunit dehydrogenase-like oxidoreductase (DUF2520 family)